MEAALQQVLDVLPPEVAQLPAWQLAGAAAAIVFVAAAAAFFTCQPNRDGGKLTQISVFPLKSGKGIHMTKHEHWWLVDHLGLSYDRRWMLVCQEGDFLTQRQLTHMARIRALPLDEGGQVIQHGDKACSALRLEWTDEQETTLSRLEVPLTQSDDLEAGTAPAGCGRASVSIWRSDGVPAIDQGDEVAEWLMRHLMPDGPGRVAGRDVTAIRMVFMDDSGDGPPARLNSKRWRLDGKRHRVSFADGFPILLASNKSLDKLNASLPADTPPMEMLRFRPNLIVSGGKAPAWCEDNWKTVQVGPARLHGFKRCVRCPMPSINQATGVGGSLKKEPLPTLSRIHCTSKGQPLFGNNMIHDVHSHDVLRIGDPVYIEERAKLPPF